MSVVSTIRHAARERVLYPIAGRVLDRALRWYRSQYMLEDLAFSVAHALIENSTALGARTAIAEAIRDARPYLSKDSIEFLLSIGAIVQKHSSAAN